MVQTIWMTALLAAFLLTVFLLWRTWNDKRKIMKNIREISGQLEHILAENTEEKVMSFTSSEDVKRLISSTNAILEDRQRQKAEYIRTELSYKQMLSNISHDVKTPLTVILGYLEILQMQENASPLLLKVQKKAEQVMELMNEFFTLAKLESGDMPLEMERVELNEVCRRNILDFYQLLQEKEFQVEITLPETPVYVYGSQGAFDRILFNLISNAIRYGGDGKYLKISLQSSGKNAKIQVADHGKGIPEAELAHVFERLYTLEDSRNREMQGNGLGLTIVKRLVQRMGGTVCVESVPKELTVFKVCVPVIKY